MLYPIAIHKDAKSDYGVTVPDLPGCFSAGSTIDEAIRMAREAIELYLEDGLASNEVPPEPSDIEALRNDPDFADAIWAVVSVDAERPTRAA